MNATSKREKDLLGIVLDIGGNLKVQGVGNQ